MIYFLIVILSLILDQLTKQMIVSRLNLHQSITVIDNFFKITYTRNTGGAFSILRNHPGFLTGLSIVLCVLSLFFIVKIIKSGVFYQVGIGLVIGGTLGNLADRLRFGYVIDFIDFSFWATFNIADIAITLGSMLLIYTVFKDESRRENGDEEFTPRLHESCPLDMTAENSTTDESIANAGAGDFTNSRNQVTSE